MLKKKKIEGSLASWRPCLAQRSVILDGDKVLEAWSAHRTQTHAPKLMRGGGWEGGALSPLQGTRPAGSAGRRQHLNSETSVPAQCDPLRFGGSVLLSLSPSYHIYKNGVIIAFSSVYTQKIVRIIKRNKEGKNSLWQEQSHCCSIWPRTGIFLQRIHPNSATVFTVISQKLLI